MLPHHRQRDTLKTFVYEGFNNWKKALSAFDCHEISELHRSALQVIRNQTNKTVLELSHKRKIKVMKENRVAFKKFSPVLISRMPSLTITGKEEATSNLAMLLQEQMEDVAEITQWLKRKER